MGRIDKRDVHQTRRRGDDGVEQGLVIGMNLHRGQRPRQLTGVENFARADVVEELREFAQLFTMIAARLESASPC